MRKIWKVWFTFDENNKITGCFQQEINALRKSKHKKIKCLTIPTDIPFVPSNVAIEREPKDTIYWVIYQFKGDNKIIRGIYKDMERALTYCCKNKWYVPYGMKLSTDFYDKDTLLEGKNGKQNY